MNMKLRALAEFVWSFICIINTLTSDNLLSASLWFLGTLLSFILGTITILEIRRINNGGS